MKLPEENLLRATTLDEFVAKVQQSTALVAAADGEFIWWRGQAKLSWVLSPRLHRESYSRFERDLTRRFMSGAAVRHSKVPETDYVSWLCLMQHYRLPTRLLDWTESALVAAHFAVSEHPNESGAVWGICPSRLNECQDPSAGHDVLRMMQVKRPTSWFGMTYSPADNYVRAAFEHSRGELPPKTFAIPTNHFDLRQLVQQSTFTVHSDERGLEELEECSRFLVRIEIPSGAKASIKDALVALGINESYLFPDLENLAKDIERRYMRT
jgi:hypothetical protein